MGVVYKAEDTKLRRSNRFSIRCATMLALRSCWRMWVWPAELPQADHGGLSTQNPHCGLSPDVTQSAA